VLLLPLKITGSAFSLSPSVSVDSVLSIVINILSNKRVCLFQ
jgi:hypothetical protein